MSGKVKARVTTNNARAGKNGVFLAKHLDGPDGKAAKMGGLLYTWHCYKDKTKTFEQVEADFYASHFADGLAAQNERHRKGGHKDRMRTMDEYRASKNGCPECTLFYLGDKDVNAGPDVLLAVVVDFWKWRKATFPQVKGLDMALHIEDGAPHIHERHVWIGHDKDGNEIVNQEAALAEMGVLPPEPGKKVTRWNNAKMTYTEICREKMMEIARAYGVEVIDEPREAGQKGLEQARFKTQDEQRKQKEAERVRKAEEEKARKADQDAQASTQKAQEMRDWLERAAVARNALEDEMEEMEATAKEKARNIIQDAQKSAKKLMEAGYDDGYTQGEKAAQKAAKGQIEAAMQQGYLDGYEVGAAEGGSTARGRLAEMRAQADAKERQAQAEAQGISYPGS